jgi:hypothetical protein
MFSGINRSCRVPAAVTAAGLLALTTACDSKAAGSSNAADSSKAGAVAGASGATVRMSFDITGAVTVKGDSASVPAFDSAKAPVSCATYAKGGQKDGAVHFVLPSVMHDKVGGKQLLVGATIDKYTGPGTYGTDQLTDQGTPAGIDVDGKTYFQQTSSTSAAVINADGGGTWTFTDLNVQNPDGTEGTPKISGKLTWTCTG